MQLLYFLTWEFWRGVVREILQKRREKRHERIRKALKLALLALLLPGCAQMFASKTIARYVVHPDGTREVFYESGKEQIGLDATVDKNGLLHVKVDKASTQEAVIAASLALQTRLVELLRDLAPLLKAAAGAPVPPGQLR